MSRHATPPRTPVIPPMLSRYMRQSPNPQQQWRHRGSGHGGRNRQFAQIASVPSLLALAPISGAIVDAASAHSTSSCRRFVLVSSIISLPSPDRTVLVAYKVKPLSWP